MGDYGILDMCMQLLIFVPHLNKPTSVHEESTEVTLQEETAHCNKSAVKAAWQHEETVNLLNSAG